MKYKKTIILLALVVFLLSIAGVSASEIGDTIASEDTGEIELSHEIESANDNLGTSEEQKVTQTDNEEKTGATDDGTFGALESKISSASSGDTIYLENNYSCEDSWTQDSGIFIIKSNLVIDGQGHTIDAKQKTRIFCVDEVDNVTIKNIKFINAKYEDSGGAIFWYEGANGSVSGCSFVNCSDEYDGGAIEWSHSDGGCVSGCSFVNCSAAGSGGAIDWYDSANGNISDCAFINNTDNDGRAINMDSGSSASLDRNWFGNTAENYKTSPNAYIDGASTDSWLFLNATVNPESISIAETADIIFKLYLYNGSISDYTSLAKVDLTLNSNGKLDKNVTGLDEKVTFTPTSLGTGSVTATIGDVAYTTTLTVTTDGTTFWDLNQTINGNTNDTITLDKNYAYNPASDSAFIEGIAITRQVTINGNGHTIDAKGQARILLVICDNVNINNVTFLNGKFSGHGGAIYFDSTGTVTNCNFTNNTVTGDYSSGGAVYFTRTGNVTNCNFVDNTANYEGGAVYFGDPGTVSNCNFTNNTAGDWGGAIRMSSGTVTNCNFTDNSATVNGGAVYFHRTGNVTNCNFTNNTATSQGGAVYFGDPGTVTNCNFTDNIATSQGGAVYFYRTGNVTNCNFTDNSATVYGGAVFFDRTGTVTNCNFTDNTAITGSAIYFYKYYSSDTLTVSDSTFLNNKANAGALDVVKNDNNITITFTGQNNLLNAIYSKNGAEVTFTNVTYWGAKGITTVSATMSGSNKAAGQKITVGVVVNNELVLNEVNVTDENGMIVLDINAGENYYISARHDADSYYTEAEKTISNNTKFNVNVTSQTTNNKTVNITAKSNIPNDVVQGKLLFILPNGTQINATYGTNGTWWAVHTFDAYGEYKVNATYVGLDNVTINNGTITINKVNSTITLENIVLDYGETKNVTVTTTGATGITAKIDGNNVTVINNYTIPISGLGAGNYTLTVTTIPDDDHNPVTKEVNITVNKVNSTLSVNDIVFDYGSSGSTVVSLAGAYGVNATVVGQPKAVVKVNGTNITVSGLGAGTYTLTVTTIADKNHNNITKNATITVNKVNSTLTLDDVVLDYGESKNITVTTEGATGITAKIDGVNVTVSNYTILISELKAGNHTLTVTTIPDDDHNPVTKTANITVNKVDSTLTVDDITFDYNGSGSTVVSFTGADGVNASVVNQSNAVVKVNGTNITVSALNAGTYTLTVTAIADANHNNITKNATITVNKLKTELTGNAITATYNINKDLVITLKDNQGNALTGANVTVVLNGAKTYTTDSNGQIKVQTKGLAPKTYTVKVTYNGDTNYDKSTKDIKVTVNKATPKLTAKKKTFKRTTKTKKYKITLKDNTGKAIKNAKVTLKVKGKTYKATTNSKGKATFKITKLNKKGTFKAVIKYKGNKYYSKVSKKAKIKVIVTFKTVSKGSKDKSTVKEIQQALKDHGYYLSYKGHYLKVDGKFNSCTFRSVKEFQHDKGLKVTGKVDEKTAKKLGIL